MCLALTENVKEYMSTNHTAELLLEYIKSGLNIKEISELTGLSKQTVAIRLRKTDYKKFYKKKNGPEPKISDQLLIEFFNSGKTAIEISEISNTDITSIRRRMKKLGINCKTNSGAADWDEGFKQMIIFEYLSGKKSHVLKERFGVSEVTVLKWVRAMGHNVVTNPQIIELRNKNFFEEVTKESAYFMGLFITDGGFRKHHISIYLKNEDDYILKKFADLIGSDHKFTYKKDGTCGFGFTDRSVSEFFTKNLKLPSHRKTYEMGFPVEVFSYYKSQLIHLLRGIIDGDGSVYYNTNYFHKISICSYSREFCENLKEIISNLIGRNCGCVLKSRDKEIYTVVFSGGKICRAIIEKIYHGSESLRLERKYDNAMKIMNHLNK